MEEDWQRLARQEPTLPVPPVMRMVPVGEAIINISGSTASESLGELRMISCCSIASHRPYFYT